MTIFGCLDMEEAAEKTNTSTTTSFMSDTTAMHFSVVIWLFSYEAESFKSDEIQSHAVS